MGRLTALGAVLAALVSVLLAVPAAPAGAVPAATAVYPVVLDDLSPRVAGTETDLQARLFAGQTALAGQELGLQIKPYGATDFTDAGLATTDDQGVATVGVTLSRSATYRWTYAGDVVHDYAASDSLVYPVQVAPRIGVRLNDRTLRRGQRLVVRGRTFPVKAGCRVSLWRGELRPLVLGPTPVRLARSTVRADGSYRLVRRFHHRARMRVVVKVAACAGNASGLSAYRRIVVR